MSVRAALVRGRERKREKILAPTRLLSSCVTRDSVRTTRTVETTVGAMFSTRPLI